MKKRYVLMGLLSLLFLGACSNNKQETTSSSSSHVSSSLASTDTINQTLDTVGSLKYHLGTVTTRKVENDRNNYTEAERKFKYKSSLGDTYYRTTITYSVTNVGEETINLAKTPLSVTTDDGSKFTSTGKLNHYAHNVLVNGYKLKVGKKLQGKLVLLSSHKLDISSIQLNIGTQVPYNSIDDTAEVTSENTTNSATTSSAVSSTTSSASSSDGISPDLQQQLIQNEQGENKVNGSNSGSSNSSTSSSSAQTGTSETAQ